MTSSKKDKIKKSHLIGGSILILIGLAIVMTPIIIKSIDEYKENIKIEIFFENEYSSIESSTESFTNHNVDNSSNYIAILEIPKINLRKGLYSINNMNNNVNRNVQILEASNMPDETNGNFILASHSGTGRTAYFNDLPKLDINDLVYIYYNNIKYTYQIYDKYNVDKDGTIEVSRIKNKSMITLTTCNQIDKSKQVVVLGELIEKEYY